MISEGALRSGAMLALVAEWEIAIASCLARKGRIETITSSEVVRKLEVIYVGSAGIASRSR
jgi:hypothetical protein